MYRTSNQLGSSAAGRTLVAVGRRAAPPGEHPVSKEGSPARAGGRGLHAFTLELNLCNSRTHS